MPSENQAAQNGPGSKVRVACVQFQARRVRDFAEFAERMEYFTATAAAYESDFVVFPEFFAVQLLSSLEKPDGPAELRELEQFTPSLLELTGRLARKHKLHVVAGSHPLAEGGKLYNTSLLGRPDGTLAEQRKLHITPSEKKHWGVAGGDFLHAFVTPKAKVGILICYDVEFPEAARHLADEGAEIIFVPYCTDTRQAYLRVRYCAQARAVENQVYVAAAGLVGNQPGVPAMDIHYGQAAIFTPSDFEFPRDGILAEADPNVETLLVADLDIADLHRTRQDGSVTPRLDRRGDLFEFKHWPGRAT
ncbi:MAG: carbon-nitrogen hydrolase family protein [Opitutales bacterium]|jgi:predicted amidohydrolase